MSNSASDTLQRRQRILAQTDPATALNGIDYVEVATGAILEITFLLPLPAGAYGLTTPPYDQIKVTGGVRIRNINVIEVAPGATTNTLTVELDTPGDRSTYTLTINNPRIDPVFRKQDFIFRPDCLSDFDCEAEPLSAPTVYTEPLIDYQAKDYASFRTALLDFVQTRVSTWEESPADLGVALAEVFSYVGDHLSYYQDAVMNEAWLQTARQRESVRRHALLIDYRMHDGCAARAFVHVAVDAAGTIPAGTPITTAAAATEAAITFETIAPITVSKDLNEIVIYPWDSRTFELPKGTTEFDLKGDLPLTAGQYLVLEEVLGPATGAAADADPDQRQVVRIREVKKTSDPLPAADGSDVKLTRVILEEDDALTRDFTVTTVLDDGTLIQNLTVSRGNILLAEQGLKVTEIIPAIDPPANRVYQVKLTEGPLTFRAPYDADSPVAALLDSDPRQAAPRVLVTLDPPVGDTRTWTPVPDLLEADATDEAFVVETDNEGRAILRFGDGTYGKRPPRGSVLGIEYRVGNGLAGNIGAEALTVLGKDPSNAAWPFTAEVRNPLPAWGGTEPESTDSVVRVAPMAFRQVQYRAVTEADYVAAAETHPDVARAVATFLWTGSWYTAFITVDPKKRQGLTPVLRESIYRHVSRYELSGYDTEIVEPTYVPLEVTVDVCVSTGHFQADVEEALLQALSNGELPDGSRGFFHPDNFTFAQPVYVSRLYEAIEAVPGVASAHVVMFRRYGRLTASEPIRIAMERTEIARLDNDPNYPENGLLRLNMKGGQR